MWKQFQSASRKLSFQSGIVRPNRGFLQPGQLLTVPVPDPVLVNVQAALPTAGPAVARHGQSQDAQANAGSD
jgi:hypothetical protein